MHNRLGPNDGYGIKNARTATIEPNEQGAIGPTQIQPTWRAVLQDIELMRSTRISASNRRRDLKQSRNIPMKRKAIAIINRNHVLIRLPPSPRRMGFRKPQGREHGGRERVTATSATQLRSARAIVLILN
jgi:hypothetical protein